MSCSERSIAPQSLALHLFDDSCGWTVSSAAELETEWRLTLSLLTFRIRRWLGEAQISAEAFAELKAEVLDGLNLLPDSLELKKLSKAILKLLARAEKALARDNEARARRYLSDVVDRLEKVTA